ncbi:hypothetical protein C0971_04970 [Bacillus methanolicus]|uniref:hypothetical protein n=1 Tax=Bacillus methanolicus TaxID=1471 RepID=UPI00200F187D|nr:hypothetical protein [Bacillus methanolicus]UQD51443.1 hypothetical protein C0971_04970 [Bacillus methanolicus]
MGYIFPSGYDQYHQYAVRELGNKNRSFRFLPVARINIEGNGLIPFQALNADKRIFAEKEIASGNKYTISRKTIEKTYAEVTGIGKHFCEII